MVEVEALECQRRLRVGGGDSLDRRNIEPGKEGRVIVVAIDVPAREDNQTPAPFHEGGDSFRVAGGERSHVRKKKHIRLVQAEGGKFLVRGLADVEQRPL